MTLALSAEVALRARRALRRGPLKQGQRVFLLLFIPASLALFLMNLYAFMLLTGK